MSTELPNTITPKSISTATNSVGQPQEYVAFENQVDVHEAAFSADHTRVAFGDFVSGQIVIWDLVNRKQVNSLPSWPFLKSIAFSPNGQAIATGHKSGGKNEQIIILVLDPISGKDLHNFRGFADISDLTFTTDGEFLAVADTGAPMVYSLATNDVYKYYKTNEPAISVAISSDGKTIAAGLWDGTIKLWNYADDKLLVDIKGLENSLEYGFVAELSFSPDGTKLASRTADNNIAVWNSINGELIRAIENPAAVYSMAFSFDSRILAVGTGDGIYLWAISSGNKLCELSTKSSPIVGLDFVADGRKIAAVSKDGEILLWDISQTCA